MTTAKSLYQRWINELWAGKPIAAELVSEDFVGHWPNREVRGPEELQSVVDETHAMFSELQFVVDVEPFTERDLLAARWVGTGSTAQGPAQFTGNDILRLADDRFVEYWTGTSTG
ncbi:ester cyclase [Mycobacterium sp. NPDC048908]|uniref:ester cyclase n=1 Tax=Mycobacterium sp. NPDC048908 TaxID=3364292 RepID=UPI0037195F3D